MKISIITVSYNTARFIRSCIDSVLSQDYLDIEYIIIDGASTDGTQDIVRSYGNQIAHFISEKDKGIYDAMNKGLRLATGEIVGILNADDFYPHDGVLSRVADEFMTTGVDTTFGDLVYVEEDNLDKTVRYFRGKGFKPSLMRKGIMPPHPTFFVRRSLYEKYGLFDPSYKICADFDIMVRLFCDAEVSYSYIPETLVKMRTGGVSTNGIKSTLTINREMYEALKKYGISTSMPRIYSKYFTKVFQLVARPN